MTWISILPALLTIIFAIATKRVLPSLLVGVMSGGLLLKKNFMGGIETSIDYIIKSLSDKNNLHVLVFLYLFSAFVFLIRRSGGIKSFTQLAEKHIKEKNQVFYALWALIPLTFIDCGFRVVAAGSILKPLADKKSISHERLAFMLNNTASPLIELIPLATTFVAYNLGLIQQGLSAAGIKDESAYTVLLQSIPFQFFSIAVLIFTFSLIFIKWKDPRRNENKNSDKKEAMDMDMGTKDPEITPRLLNLILPLFLLIGLSIGLLAIKYFQEIGKTQELSKIILSMEPGKTMLIAVFLSLIGSAILFLIQGYKIKKISTDLIEGGNQIFSTLAILILAWPLSKISQDLGLGQLVEQGLTGNIPLWLIPVAAFFITALVTYFIGSSWGAQALVMPVAIPLAVSGHANIAIVVAAVISGGSYGDVTSPVSGMTNMAAHISDANHDLYVRKAFFYNTIAGAVAALGFIAVPLLNH